MEPIVIKAKHLSDEEKEDLALGELLKDVNRTKKVSRTKVMAKLGRKQNVIA